MWTEQVFLYCSITLARSSPLDYSFVRQYRPSVPTILQVGPYRFFFYSGDRDEPLHVHVQRDKKIAKFWLAPVRLQTGGGLAKSDIRRIQNLVEDKIEILTRSWNEYFNV